MAADPEGEALDVLRGIWAARGQGRAVVPGATKVCKNMKDIGFGGMAGGAAEGASTAGPVDDEQRRAWRERLAREGKLGTGSVRDLVLGADAPAPAAPAPDVTAPDVTGPGRE
ncbi:MAG: hypothetical protein NTW05_28830 [Pseudonocardiales bacterium]|nr:hypothetical protein [Pseudonocardiales bacterium]